MGTVRHLCCCTSGVAGCARGHVAAGARRHRRREAGRRGDVPPVTVAPQPLPRAELTARLGLLATPRMRRTEMLALLSECGSGERAFREVRGTEADDIVHARVQRALQLIE